MRVSDKFADLVLRVIEALGTHLVQLGKFLALDAEPLIVGKMPVQDVHLHGGHAVHIAFEHVERDEVAADVDEQSAPREAGLVFDGGGGDGEAGGGGLD